MKLNELKELIRECVSEVITEGMYEKVHKAMDTLRKRSPNGYAQLVSSAFGPYPSDAENDPRHPFWKSQDAQDLLDSILNSDEYLYSDKSLERSKNEKVANMSPEYADKLKSGGYLNK